ncbi:hypothetical protein EVJ58_g5089 [Rhodofomes roseus]|uniref:Uncharacterized protein n=1 Tax=Rhodofomes roseus TaxID=34475 RepID=A0A4Y9YDE5_9APHY|nr:hypothetical protein EVJ58_g5089 [Rhodofomes roseus]
MLFTFRLSPSALVGLSVLALGPQPVLSVFDFVTFSSPSQCAPFTIQYSGGTAPTSWPPQLTVVPFNSTPFSIPLFNAVFNDTSETGHAVTFLPLPQGTQFVASLDDGNGDSAGPVSDVITIDADNSTKCLQFEKNETANPFSLVNTPSQCESFTVNFDTAEAAAPTVRAFITGKLAFTANQTANDATAGSASYLMAAAHGTEVTLLFSDGSNKASSGLLTVGGNRKSSGTCLVAASSSTGKGANATASTSMSASADSMASKQSTAPLSQ